MARSKQQQSLPGEEYQRPSIPEVEEAAEEYRALRDERMNLSEREAIAKKALIAKMTEHNVTVFRYDDSEGIERRVELQTKTNAKVAKVKSKDNDSSPSEDVDVS